MSLTNRRELIWPESQRVCLLVSLLFVPFLAIAQDWQRFVDTDEFFAINIPGEPKVAGSYVIDHDKCINCGMCVEVCKPDCILVE